MFFFDPLYLLVMIASMALAGWAQWKVRAAIGKWSKVPARSGMTGADVARFILQHEGIHDVRIEPVGGFLTDHYDSRHKVLRLSPDNFHGRSVAAIGVAAHEVGHAIQHARGYAPLMVRQAIAPAAALGSNLSMWIIFLGAIVGAMGLVKIGIAAFSLAVFFTLVTLPVEFNASTRAKRILQQAGLVTGTEARGVAACLDVAAMTYVAAAVTSLMYLLYLLFRFGLLGGSDD